MSKDAQTSLEPSHAIPRKKQDEAVPVFDRALEPPAPGVILHRAALAPQSLRPTDILRLQQTLGNRAVGALLRQLTPARSLVQAKLMVHAAGDKFEQEADRVADAVMCMPARRRTRSEDGVQTPAVQRAELEDEDAKPDVMTKPQPSSAAGGAFEASGVFEQGLQAARGQGQLLPSALRENFEAKFGADFSRVRIHTDAQSDRLNQSIQAQAFTTGRDVFFRQGVYDPASRSGQTVIAHELTHVLQQNQQHMPGSRSSWAIQRLVSGQRLNQQVKPGGGPTYKRLIKELDGYQEKIHALAVEKEDDNRKTQANQLNNGDLKQILNTTINYSEAHRTEDTPRAKRIFALKNEIREEGDIVQEVGAATVWREPKLEQNWAEAIALTRTGVQPRAGLRATGFTDRNLKGSLEELGSGNVNTVYSGKWVTESGTFRGVYKRETHKPEQIVSEGATNMPAALQRRNYAARNVAISELNKLLGLDVIPRTEFAVIDGYFGTVMEEIKDGLQVQEKVWIKLPEVMDPKPELIRLNVQNLQTEDLAQIALFADYEKSTFVISELENIDKQIGLLKESINNESDEEKKTKKQKKLQDLEKTKELTLNEWKSAGSPKWNPKKTKILRTKTFERVKPELFNEPDLMRALSNLQLLDAIAVSADRHAGNYFIVKENGRWTVKGIDNDVSFGNVTIDKLIQQLQPGIHYLGIPDIVDEEVAEKIIGTDQRDVIRVLEPYLEQDEVVAAVKRFLEVKTKLRDLKGKKQLIRDWTDKGLPAKMMVTKTGSYVGREKSFIETSMSYKQALETHTKYMEKLKQQT